MIGSVPLTHDDIYYRESYMFYHTKWLQLVTYKSKATTHHEISVTPMRPPDDRASLVIYCSSFAT